MFKMSLKRTMTNDILLYNAYIRIKLALFTAKFQGVLLSVLSLSKEIMSSKRVDLKTSSTSESPWSHPPHFHRLVHSWIQK